MKKYLKQIRKWLGNRIVSFYIFLILAVLPLFFHDYYFDITEAKYEFVKYTTIICAIFYLLFHDAKEVSVKMLFSLKPMIFYFIFLIFGAASVLLSEYQAAAFFGSAGRYKGWLIYLVYGIGLVMIALGGKVRPGHLYFMELSAGLAGILAILNFYYIDVFGFFRELREDQHLAFTSTFGNIGIFGDYISMMLAASGILFCISGKKTRVVFLHGIIYEICVAALLMDSADGAFIGVFFFYAVFPLFIREKIELQRFLCLLLSFFGTGAALGALNKNLHVKEIRGICLAVQNHVTVCLAVFAALLFLYIITTFIKLKSAGVIRAVKTGYGVSLILLFLSAGTILFAVNFFASNIGACVVYNEEIRNLFYFSDEWGTYRGYIWRLMWESFWNLPVLKKLVGIGPDTLYYLYRENHVRIDYPVKAFDNAHNIYLQILVGHGILGLFSWLGWGISSLVICIKKGMQDRRFLVVFFVLITYAWNGLVGLNTIHVSAIALAFMGMCLCSFKDEACEGAI